MKANQLFGGGVSDTTISPIVLVGMLIAIVLIGALPRKHVIAPVLLGLFLVPLGQVIYALGVHWLEARLVILAGLIRIAATKSRPIGKTSENKWNPVDRVFFGCVSINALAFVLQYMQSDALVNQFGVLIDFLGAYAVFRGLIQDRDDIYRTLKWLAFLTVILGACMIWEHLAFQNVFGFLGGVPITPELRENKIRARGVFQHPIPAGCFGATLLPLFILLARKTDARVVGFIGVAGCTVVTVCSNSSTSLLAYAAGLFAVCFWPLRTHMQRVRWVLSISLVVLHFLMKAPVWFLLAHIDLTGGSSGYHRAELIDQCISHFRDWWLMGTKDAANWGWDMWDQQNMFVNFAESGGLVVLCLLIAVFSRSLRMIGNARKLAPNRGEEWFVWLLGSALFAHLVAFFGANYFDQSKDGWFLLLAMIPAATACSLKKEHLLGSMVEAESLSDHQLATNSWGSV
jgi:hypothetical protein